jgi:hypothetical protein
MRWPWSRKPPDEHPLGQDEFMGVDEVTDPGRPVGFMAPGQPNKVTPQKHKPFPNRMNRNKRMK